MIMYSPLMDSYSRSDDTWLCNHTKFLKNPTCPIYNFKSQTKQSIPIALFFPGQATIIVLSSTAGAAERQGSLLGEFVEAGYYGERSYFLQRDTEGNTEQFLYHINNKWMVVCFFSLSISKKYWVPLQTASKP